MSGRSRPHDWHPLTAGDPVPGDPAAILEEVAHIRQIAAMLRTEARDLRAIAEGHGLKGRYAEALRDGARELELRLRETAERYERVHSGLSGWAHELEEFQTQAGHVLRSARAAADAAASDDPGEDSTAPHRAALAGITAQRDERARHYAARIRDEIDDTIKDSWWEGVKDAVDDHAGAISFVVDAMSWVATGIALAAITMTPAGWIAGLAVWLTCGVLAGHLLLASSADGSWADVAMDVFGLLTMQVGTIALTKLRGVRDATKLAAELAAEDRAVEATARSARPCATERRRWSTAAPPRERRGRRRATPAISPGRRPSAPAWRRPPRRRRSPSRRRPAGRRRRWGRTRNGESP